MLTHFRLPGGGHFNPDFDLENDDGENPSNIQLAFELVKEANVLLAKYGFTSLEPHDFHHVKEISSEVGDDIEILSNSKAFVGLQAPFIQLMGQKVSWEDTSINSHMGNFAEELVLKPSSNYQTYEWMRKTHSNGESLAFLDVPKLRLAIDVRPGRMNHSSTNDGKASMVGSRNSWIPTKSPIKGIYEIFSLYQDVNLGLKRDPRFAYFPQHLAGYGKRIPFDEPSNYRRFNECYRQGSVQDLNNEILLRTVKMYERFNYEPNAKDDLLAHISRFKSQYHDWIKGRSIWCPTTWVECPDNLSKYRVENLSRPAVRVIAQRATSVGVTVHESVLSAHIEHNDLCNALLGEENMSSFKERIKKKRAEWMTLSIYNLKSMGFIRELSLESFGRKPKEKDIEVFYSENRSRAAFLKGMLEKGDYFFRESLDEVYKNGPMMVHFNCMPQSGAGHRTYAEHRFDFSLQKEFRVKTTLETWLRNQDKPPPTEEVSDDEIIESEVKLHTVVAIVTDDVALCRAINSRRGNPVVRYPVARYWFENTATPAAFSSLWDTILENQTPPWHGVILGMYPQMEIQFFEDTGSINAYQAITHNGKIHCSGHPFRVTTFKQGDPFVIARENRDISSVNWRPSVFDRYNFLRRARGK
jgi:hypothetical protein